MCMQQKLFANCEQQRRGTYTCHSDQHFNQLFLVEVELNIKVCAILLYVAMQPLKKLNSDVSTTYHMLLQFMKIRLKIVYKMKKKNNTYVYPLASIFLFYTTHLLMSFNNDNQTSSNCLVLFSRHFKLPRLRSLLTRC